MSTFRIRKTLRAGSLVFGISALFLLVLPNLFLELLGLDKSDSLVWSMRMIGITVFALAGNMWNNAGQSSDARVENVAKVMCLSAASLGVLTLMIPVKLTWFSYIYAAIGFGFAIAYAFNLLKSSK
jgi:Ca2+/H+ antiporter